MPITTSAKKALRRDKRRQAVNYKIREKIKKSVDKIKKGSNDPKDFSVLQSTLDSASKKNIIHPKKVDRMKSRLNKLVKSRSDSKETTKKESKPTKKKASTKKATAKKTTTKKTK